MKSKPALGLFVATLLLLALPWSSPLRGNPTICPILELAYALDQFDPLEGNAIVTLLHDIDRIDIIRDKKFETGGPMHVLVEKYAKLVKDTGSALTEEGAKGAFRLSACLVKTSGTNFDFTDHLRDAFTKGGAFKGTQFDLVMRQLADTDLFEFDASVRKFTSAEGLQYIERPGGPYPGTGAGENHSIPHIMKGHLDNGSQTIKSKFNDDFAGSMFHNFDSAYAMFKQLRAQTNLEINPAGNVRWRPNFQGGFDVEIGFQGIGTGQEDVLRLAIRGDSSVITAFPRVGFEIE